MDAVTPIVEFDHDHTVEKPVVADQDVTVCSLLDAVAEGDTLTQPSRRRLQVGRQGRDIVRH